MIVLGNFNLIKLSNTVSNRRACLVVICAQLTLVFSGSVAMVACTQQIFKGSGSALTPGNSYMVLGAVKICSGLVITQS